MKDNFENQTPLLQLYNSRFTQPIDSTIVSNQKTNLDKYDFSSLNNQDLPKINEESLNLNKSLNSHTNQSHQNQETFNHRFSKLKNQKDEEDKQKE